MNAIKDRYPDLYKKLKRMKPPKDVKVVKTPSGHPTAKWRIKGKWEYVHDPTNPREAATRFVFREKNLTNPRLVVFLGFGLGYNVFAFLENRPPVNSAVVVVEEEPKFLWLAFHKFDLTPMLERDDVYFVVGVGHDRLFLHLMAIMEEGGLVRFAKAFEFIEEPVLYREGKEYYKLFIETFKLAIRETLNNIGNDPKDSFIGLDNTLANHRFLIENPGINQLFDKFKGVPAIIVATGPSLNKNINQLKGCEERALIISVDASLKPLLKHGITPHLVTSLERVPLVKKFFTRIPAERLRNTFLVAIPLLTPDSLAAYKGEKIVALRAFAHYYWLGIDKGILSIGPSSANMGFSIAEAMGCDPIVLVGQDLAYAPDGRTHAADNALGEKQEAILPEKMDTLWVRGNYVDRILTNRIWHMFLKSFEHSIATYAGTCINATEGGAFIQGSKVMTLQEAKGKYLRKRYDIVGNIRGNIIPTSQEEIEESYRHLKRLLKEGIEELNQCIYECREWERKIEEYLQANFSGKIDDEAELYARNVSFIKEISKYKGELIDKKSYKGIMYHIMQSFLVGEEIIFNAVPVYNNPDPIASQKGIIVEHIEWFKTNYKFMEKTREILKRHLRKVEKHLS